MPIRRVLTLLLGAVGIVAGLAACVLIYAASVNLAPLVQRYSNTLLGRPVKLGALYLDFGRTIHLSARDVRVPAAIDPKLPDLAAIGHVETSVRLFPLFAGRLVIQSVTVDDLKVMLARDNDGTGNWAASREPPPASKTEAKRTTLPPLLNAVARDADITYVDAAGNTFPVRIEALQLHTPGAANPVQLGVQGAVDGVPLTVKAVLQSFNDLQDFSKPFSGKLTLSSGKNTATYEGTATDPLNLGGLNGTLDLDAPALSGLAASVGLSLPPDLALSLTASLKGQKDQWHLRDAHGTLQGASFDGAADYSEGRDGQADTLSSTVRFDALGLDALAGQGGSGGPAKLPAVPAHPGVLLDLRLEAQSATYQGFTVTGLKTHVVTEPGQAKLDAMQFGFAGGQVSASGLAENKQDGLRLSGSANVDGIDAGAAYRAAGSSSPPLKGPVSGHAQFDLTGATLPGALGHGRITGAMAMSGGTMSRKLMRMAKANVRALWTDGGATTPLRCLLAAVDVQDGAGTVNPVQVETPIGTLAAWGQVNLQQRTIDMILRSQDETTDGLGLDVPIHVSGAMADPNIQPKSGLLQDYPRPASPGTWPSEIGGIIRGSACDPG